MRVDRIFSVYTWHCKLGLGSQLWVGVRQRHLCLRVLCHATVARHTKKAVKVSKRCIAMPEAAILEGRWWSSAALQLLSSALSCAQLRQNLQVPCRQKCFCFKDVPQGLILGVSAYALLS